MAYPTKNTTSTLPLRVDPQSGRLEPGVFIESPNQDDRPAETAPRLVVVHGISLPPRQFGGDGVVQLFTNQLDPKAHPYYESIHQLRVSAHAFIRRDGSIIQFVPFHKRAWHAGVSEFLGQTRCNDFSIGIELEGTDDQPYTASQYEVLAQLIKGLWLAYPSLHEKHVVGHSDIAPGRKTDPGPFFLWPALQRLLQTT